MRGYTGHSFYIMEKQPFTINNLPLANYIFDCLGEVLDKTSISPLSALRVLEADPQEQYLHVELPSPENGLKTPQLWRIADWKSSYARHQRIKNLKAHERAIENIAAEVRARFVSAMAAKMYITKEACAPMVAQLVKERNINAAACFGLDLQELLDADDALVEFRKQHGLKQS